ncbi:MAG TPA: DUF1801 domain-containing protein [Bdellovibrionales bacterium]|nr:DUF1801 domain-containing protein [Bdellovibrionales bacterium]
MRAGKNIKTPKQYLDSLEGPRKRQLLDLHKFIRAKAPGLKPVMLSGMLGYGLFQYKYPSGREGEWFRIGLASQKNYISLYFCAIAKNGKYVPENYKDELPKASIGRSCVRFKNIEDLPMPVIAKMIRDTVKAAKPSM